jgi:hypothetical protein
MGATPGYFRLHLSNEKHGLRFKVKSTPLLFAAYTTSCSDGIRKVVKMIPENRRFSNFRKEAKLKKWITIFGLAIVVFSWAGAAKSDSPLTVVDVVDLNRYLGMWYEIASYPSWFQKGCTASTAEYSLLSDGKIQVINRCHKDSLEGPLKVSKGKAEVVDTTTNAKLKVWFF